MKRNAVWRNHIFVLIWLGLSTRSHAWLSPSLQPTRTSQPQRQQRPWSFVAQQSRRDPTIPRSSSSMVGVGILLRQSSRPTDNNDYSDDTNDNDDDEELCADEEECEIDWDAMPLDETAQAATTTTRASSSARTRLEMQWEMTEATEDCDVEIPTSCGSEPCTECHGEGHKPCRFCHGTAVLYMRQPPLPPTASAYYDVAFATTSQYGMTTTATTARMEEEQTFEFSACPICEQGNEVCRSCQGTGWVASWTHWQDPAH